MDLTPFAEAYRETNRRMVQLLDFLSALHALSEVGPAVTDQRKMLDQALKGLLENQNMSRCSVFLCEHDQLVNAAGLSWAELIGLPGQAVRRAFPVGDGVMGRAVTTGVVQYSSDCRNDPAFLSLPADISPAVSSLISVPIRIADNVLGVLNVSHTDSDAFGPDEERLLTLYAHFLGQMLVNWQHVHNLEEQVGQRTRELESALEEARELQQRFQSLAVLDDLTGLHNRRFFFAEARAILARGLRQGSAASLILLDLDHFKRINDEFGHAAGDQVLQDVALALGQLVREGDVLSRYGGEEFVLLLPGTDLDGAIGLGKRIRQALAGLAWVFDDSGPQRITASIGICTLVLEGPRRHPPPGDVLENMLARADLTMYASKDAGRNCLRVSTLELLDNP
ncbi:diguanylate cyclase [Ectothiorhodospira variabilis]|uniref:sensor domain-containing diguanylate cyclase n=1 Tax=Ectothiorhodospira variabilis TaxID=505694 RepID=UPI001EFAA124|nr:sensor domain-containing diguanylate cyclase [Ectothiorhodospira variabilis]